MTRIALDTNAAQEFTVHVFDANDINSITQSDEIYKCF